MWWKNRMANLKKNRSKSIEKIKKCRIPIWFHDSGIDHRSFTLSLRCNICANVYSSTVVECGVVKFDVIEVRYPVQWTHLTSFVLKCVINIHIITSHVLRLSHLQIKLDDNYDQPDNSKFDQIDERTNHRRDRISPGVCETSYLSDARSITSTDGDKGAIHDNGNCHLDESFDRLHGLLFEIRRSHSV